MTSWSRLDSTVTGSSDTAFSRAAAALLRSTRGVCSCVHGDPKSVVGTTVRTYACSAAVSVSGRAENGVVRVGMPVEPGRRVHREGHWLGLPISVNQLPLCIFDAWDF